MINFSNIFAVIVCLFITLFIHDMKSISLFDEILCNRYSILGGLKIHTFWIFMRLFRFLRYLSQIVICIYHCDVVLFSRRVYVYGCGPLFVILLLVYIVSLIRFQDKTCCLMSLFNTLMWILFVYFTCPILK